MEIENKLANTSKWSDLIQELQKNGIRGYRNSAAHKGTVSSREVIIIRDILLEKTKISNKHNKICWLDFIISEN